MALYYNDKICVLTDEGRSNLVKQNNGIKHSIAGVLLISDYRKYLETLYSIDDSDPLSDTSLHKITLEDILKNTRVIFNKVNYTYRSEQYIPNSVQYTKALSNIKNYLTPCEISYNTASKSNLNDETEEKNNYVSYDVMLENKTFQIENNTDDDLTFDAIAFLGMPYKNEKDDEIDIINKQNLIVYAIEYFPKDKLMILKNQNNKLVMDAELHLWISNEENVTNIIPTDKSGIPVLDYNTLAAGLHITNDGMTNTINSGVSAIGGTDKLFMSTASVEEAKGYDTFAKLNIMTQANTGDVTKVVPQMMFSLSRKGQKRTWDGDRLVFKYTSGNDASYFGITEITGNRRNKLNFELLGANNIYNTVITGTYNNSFIYSQDNTVSNDSHDNEFINSDGNVFKANGIASSVFINSDNNYVHSGYSFFKTASATNLSFYNSDENKFYPGFRWIKGVKNANAAIKAVALKDGTGYMIVSATGNGTEYIKGVKGGILRNKTFIDSNYNMISGHDNITARSTFINTNSGRFINDIDGVSMTMIGNNYGYVNGVSANTIAIGIGLEHLNSSGDQIILGYYNQNSTDVNEILIVGDGRCNSAYINDLKKQFGGWENNNYQNDRFFNAFTGRGSTGYDSNFYRHNIFTVNKQGYITISDYEEPSNSARFGTHGITAYNDGAVYDIPYNRIYNKINVADAVTEMQETVDSYTRQMSDVISTMPSNYFFTISDNTKLVNVNDGGQITSSGINLSDIFINIPSAEKYNDTTDWTAKYDNITAFRNDLNSQAITAIPDVNNSVYDNTIFSGVFSLLDVAGKNSAFEDNLILGITNTQDKDHPLNIWYANIMYQPDAETQNNKINIFCDSEINSYCSVQLLWTVPNSVGADQTLNGDIISGFTHINN